VVVHVNGAASAATPTSQVALTSGGTIEVYADPTHEELVEAVGAFIDTKDACGISVKDVRRYLVSVMFPDKDLSARKAEIKQAIYAKVEQDQEQ
jgi:hypothetical protein